jgi:hypothetical protein
MTCNHPQETEALPDNAISMIQTLPVAKRSACEWSAF